MHGRRGMLAQIAADSIQATPGLWRFGISIRRRGHADGRRRHAEVVVDFRGRFVLLDPVPTAVRPLQVPDPVQGLAREGMELAPGGRVVLGEHGRRHHDFGHMKRRRLGGAEFFTGQPGGKLFQGLARLRDVSPSSWRSPAWPPDRQRWRGRRNNSSHGHAHLRPDTPPLSPAKGVARRVHSPQSGFSATCAASMPTAGLGGAERFLRRRVRSHPKHAKQHSDPRGAAGSIYTAPAWKRTVCSPAFRRFFAGFRLKPVLRTSANPSRAV